MSDAESSEHRATGAARGPADEARSLYREYFERSADAFLIIEGDTFVDCNQATVDLLGYGSREEVLQTHPSEHSPVQQPDGRPSYDKANEMMGLAFSKGSHRFEWEHRRADGSTFPVEVLLTAVPTGDRDRLHVVWRDLTHRRRLEQDLRHAQKMEALGRLSGGIAHDFNNLLVAIIGRAELLEMDLDPERDPELFEHAGEILKAGKRAADLVRQLLAFSRKQWMRPEPVALNAAVAEIRAMLGRLLGEGVRLEVRPHAEELWIEADPGQIDQVLINLAVNARDAMAGTGTLIIATAPAPDAVPGRPSDLPDGPLVRLSVEDTGAGMGPAVLPRIFEPFFTTKDAGRGTGLGLATVYGVVKQSGGDIVVTSEPGRGSRFDIYLPRLAQPTAAVAEASRPGTTGLHGSETVLLVEDEPGVVRLARTMLERAGYTVLTAGDGAEALEVLESLATPPDVLLTDIVMPRLSGPELAARACARWPGLKVVYTSGYTADKLDADGAEVPDAPLVAKPFSSHTLLQTLRGVIDGG